MLGGVVVRAAFTRSGGMNKSPTLVSKLPICD